MNTVSLYRVLKAKPHKVFRAFTDPLAMASWLPPYGFLCIVNSFQPTEGGKYHMSFVNFSTGNKHSFGGEYLEIRENEYLRYSDRFDDPNMPGEMTTTVWLKEESFGTSLTITQEGIPEMIPLEMCYLGWQDSLDKLMRLVEPEIPN